MNANDQVVGGRPFRARWYAIAAVVLVIAIVAAFLLARRADDAGDSATGAAAPRATAGMEGMAGMSTESNGAVRLTASQIREFGITFGDVDYRTLADEVHTVGIVNFDETRMVRVAPKFGGYVERLYVDFTGKPVSRGQPLLEIYSPELVAAQQELLLAAGLQRSLGASTIPGLAGGSPDLVAAARRRLLLWDITEAQVNQVLSSGTVRRTMTIYAPGSGIVMEKNVMRGQAVQAGEDLYMIADLSQVWVEAELREADAGTVREGAPATVEIASFPGRPIAGQIDYIYPSLQEEARTLKARITIPNPDGRLKPGMFANVRFAAAGRNALTVPSAAVVRTGERNLVFVDMGGGRMSTQDVEIGRTAGDYTEILTGLEPGQRVVTSAQFLLDSESNLAEVMKGMIAAGMETGDMEGMDMSGPDMQGMDMPAKKE